MPDSPAPPPNLQAILAGLIPALRVGLPSGVEAIVVLIDDQAPDAVPAATRPHLARAAAAAAVAVCIERAITPASSPFHAPKQVRDDD